MMDAFFFEVTDTFGGEANYCWVHQYIVHASSFAAAIRKVNAVEGYFKLDRIADFGDEVHWRPRGCCVVIMGSEMDEQALAMMKGNCKELT